MMRIAGMYNYLKIIMGAFAVLLSGCNGTFATLLDKPQLYATADTIPPVVTDSGIAVTNITVSGCSLSWASAVDETSSQGDLQYTVLATQASDFSEVINPSFLPGTVTRIVPWTTNYTQHVIASGLIEGVTYRITVFVRDSAGNFSQYNQPAVTPFGSDIVSPVISNDTISVTSISPTGCTLSWSPASDETTAQSNLQYAVLMTEDADFSAVTDPDSLPPTVTRIQSWTADYTRHVVASGLTEGNTYRYTVFVRDAVGNFSSYRLSPVTPSDKIPPTVGAFSVASSGVATTSISLEWTQATDNVTPQAGLKYTLVYSKTGAIESISAAEAIAGTNSLISAQPWTTGTFLHNAPALTPNTWYYYAILVYDDKNNVALYNSLSVKTLADSADTTPPVPNDPNSFVLSSGSGAYRVNASWGAATDNVTPAAQLEYSLAASGNPITTQDDFNAATKVTDPLTGGGDGWVTEAQGMSLADIPVADGVITYFALWVRDRAGNTAPYTPRSSDQTGAPRSSLATWWKFDGNANDSTTSGVNGSVTGSTTYSSDAVFGQAFDFIGNDNASKYISFSNGTVFDSLKSALTMSLWINVATFANNWETIISKSEWGFRLERYLDTGRLHFMVVHDPSNFNRSRIISVDSVTDGKWHHIVCVYAAGGGTGNERIYMYIDGILQTGIFSAEDNWYYSAGANIYMKTNAIRIGGNEKYANQEYTGKIDDVRFYRELLNVVDIRALGRK